jgi:hypothetical protein
MGLIEQAQKDFAKITGNGNDFGVPITFTSNKTSQTVTINGLHNKIGLNVDGFGASMHAKNATVAVSESLLVLAGYPVRNTEQEVDMNGDLISVADNTGIIKNYIVKSKIPDETFGSLVFILEDYKK